MAAAGGIQTGQPRLSRGQILALTAVLAGGIALGWYGFKTAFGDGSTVTAPVQTVTVQRGTLSQTATTSGNVTSQHSSKLTFPTAGRLSTIDVQVGQSVAAGDVLASLDVTTLQIALDQAKSTQISAQAKLDALLAGQTPDVIEAARASVAQAQSAVTSAEGQVASAQTGKTTAQDSAGTAANAISTAQNQAGSAQNAITTAQSQVGAAQNAVITAQSQVVNAQNQLVLAQNAYQNLIDGPTAQDVAVSQAAVESAKTSLDTAQISYDRLVSHADIATRPETTALITASAGYQVALANLANAEPQPANPFDIAGAELSVQAAQGQVGIAQTNAATAQAAFFTAISNQAALPPATPPLAAPNSVCTAIGDRFCIITNEPLQPSPGATSPSEAIANQAQAAVTTAQNQMIQASGSLITANASYQTALNNLQKLLNPISTTNLAGQQAQVDSSRQQLDIARRNFDSYVSLPDLATRPETTALNTARSGYTAAQAQFNLKVAPPRQTDINNAQAAISNAQAGIDTANAAERNAELAVNTAVVAVSNAQLSAGTAAVGVTSAQLAADSAAATAKNADSTIATAAGQVDSARAGIASAQKKLEQVLGPALATDVTQAQEAVNQAAFGVKKAQNDVDGAVILAPFSGIVTSVTANPGDQVSSGTEIVGLVDPRHVEIDAQVDETTYGQIKVGMPVSLTLDALPNQRLTGVISSIVPSGVTQQGVVLFPIVIAITSPGAIPPNQASASQIRITVQAKPNVLSVQGRYLYRDAAGRQVIDVIKDGKRIATPVQTGLATDTGTEITSGLQAGDQIALPIKKGGAASKSVVGQGGVPGLGGGGGGAVIVGPGR
ncbi:MAG: HlyD family efflux transporter periplasmic adaptor subunit [Dehalococcoidia bacterium]